MGQREAVVVNQMNGKPFLDLDPIMVKVLADGTADPRDDSLIRIFEAMLDVEAEFDLGDLVLRLVWSDTLYTQPVTINCPVCDKTCRVDDETAVEGLPDGSTAMTCCDCLFD